MIFVIGSGPAAVACAAPLAEAGLPVTLLDAGIELDAVQQRSVQLLGGHPPEAWDELDPRWRTRFKRFDVSSYDRGGPAKAAFGSFFPYDEAERVLEPGANRSVLWPSLAKGGFSNVWGGAMLPYREADLAGWPIGERDLAPHYAAVLKEMLFFAARHDGLERFFPLYTDRTTQLTPSRQASALMADLDSHRAALHGAGVHYGYPRLAVQGQTGKHEPSAGRPARQEGCQYCTLCLYGCPYGFIYNAQFTLQSLLRIPNVRYVPGVFVTRVEERGQQVRISARDRSTGAPISYDAQTVFLAAGVLGTAQILLNSMHDPSATLTIKDSQYFYLPMLRYRKVSDVARERVHTLAQLFLEIWDSSISRHTVHLQVFTYNDLYTDGLKSRLGLLYPLAHLLLGELLGRLIVVQGYLHSYDSSRMQLSLARPSPHAEGRLRVDVHLNPRVKPALRNLGAKLAGLRRELRAYPLRPLLSIGAPGRGTHCGGTFPMRETPTQGESDLLGRPYGFGRVHIVDSSVFPSVPATTITLSVMANAHRIAAQYLRH